MLKIDERFKSKMLVIIYYIITILFIHSQSIKTKQKKTNKQTKLATA
jgi:hypothetical protein